MGSTEYIFNNVMWMSEHIKRLELHIHTAVLFFFLELTSLMKSEQVGKDVKHDCSLLKKTFTYIWNNKEGSTGPLACFVLAVAI